MTPRLCKRGHLTIGPCKQCDLVRRAQYYQRKGIVLAPLMKAVLARATAKEQR
jgi:hypothetical protein